MSGRALEIVFCCIGGFGAGAHVLLEDKQAAIGARERTV
jgi:hypothetical protein